MAMYPALFPRVRVCRVIALFALVIFFCMFVAVRLPVCLFLCVFFSRSLVVFFSRVCAFFCVSIFQWVYFSCVCLDVLVYAFVSVFLSVRFSV